MNRQLLLTEAEEGMNKLMLHKKHDASHVGVTAQHASTMLNLKHQVVPTVSCLCLWVCSCP